jgi:copper chaperone
MTDLCNPSPQGDNTMPALTLVAPDISCDHCKHTIETELATLAGIEQVQVDPPVKTVRVIYDDTLVGEPAIRARLDEIGYPVGA